MSTTFVTEMELEKAGISSKNFKCTLDDVHDRKARDACREYTRNFKMLFPKGIGLTLYGTDKRVRDVYLYAIAKALIAQKVSVKVVDASEVVNLYANDRDGFDALASRYSVVAIPELSQPDETVNRMGKSAFLSFFRQRDERSLPVIVGTSMELDHPDQCIDDLYPDVAEILMGNTCMINTTGETDCKWLKEGNAITAADLKRGGARAKG